MLLTSYTRLLRWNVLAESGPRRVGCRHEMSGSEPDTTNNRMELSAALQALEALKQPCEVVVHTDSRYLRDAFERDWLKKWQSNGWRTSDRKPVVNRDLWERLLSLTQSHDVTWLWVEGHADNAENIRADELANKARERL